MPLRNLLVVLLLAVAVAACGFHLRGAQGAALPYKSLYIALPENAEVRIWLERYISADEGTALVDDGKSAEATFQQVSDNRQKSILSVDAQGRVREYRLQLTYAFRIVNAEGKEIVPPNELSLSRDLTYDDSNVLAKDQEERLLWRDMTSELVSQIMRRLSLIKPKDPAAKEEDDW
ncbi:MAG: LPS assembly lipoprotein LptE [Betaproteobacteria bacterium]|nr:LPS assembly lipoprotein LptE [Betaproteobacteria bacterium]MCL2885962.1 LPS assembly lipoprotein LptE [Betaproteobacteria bacterium]